MHPLSKPLFGVYIHWPYCLSKCPYCDFYSKPCPQPDYAKFLKAYQRDILALKRKKETFLPITSLFFGGGTPSLMPVHLIGDIIRFLRSHFLFDEDVEITIEANPDAIDKEKMKQLKKLGVNRLSLGIQALNEQALKELGRRHTLETALLRLKEAKFIFENINTDFIYARPGQTVSNWKEELNRILDLNVTHYSLYQLTIEENTPFAKKNIILPEEEIAAELYLTTNHIMQQAGFPSYEISNYAPDKYRCLHNLTYWKGDDYLGIGPSAHGRIGLWATHNPPSVEKWFLSDPLCEKLTEEERAEEKIIMGLRLTREGFPVHLLSQKGIMEAIRNGWGNVKDDLFYPTQTGFLLLNQLILILTDTK